MDEKLIEELIKVYKNAQENLIKIIATKEAKGNIVVYQKSLLRQVNEELLKLNKIAMEWTRSNIGELYYKTLQEVSADININYDEYVKNFSLLHKNAVEVVVKNISNKLIEANTFVGRRIQDEVRQAGLKAIANKVATGSTVQECKKNLINSLIDSGIGGIKDKRGRVIPVASYAELVARSTTAETTNTATITQLKSLDKDLVKMTEHNTTCPVCSIYQGRVYSISGKDDRFPYLYDIPGFETGYNNLHPRCKHRVYPYIEELSNTLEEDIKNSNKPFNIKPKDKKSIEEYTRQQQAKMQMNEDYKQWQRYRLSMPDDTPKTFAGFRRMKYSNSMKYDELMSSYKSLRQGGEG